MTFFCVDAGSGKQLWKERSFGEQWWMGIEAVCGDTVFLHKYATPSLPEHKSITAVDIKSGNVLWVNEAENVEYFRGHAVVTSSRTPVGTRFYQRNLRDGSTIKEISEADAAEMRKEEHGDAAADVLMPEPIFDLAGDGSERAAIIRGHCSDFDLVGPVEVIEHRQKLIFNYHERRSARGSDLPLHSVLKIVDKEEQALVFETTAQTSAQSVTPAMFFVWENLLMYIDERTTLTAIDLA